MTMRCSKAHKLIGDHLDGTLGGKDSARLQEHLKACVECRSLLKDFQKIAEQARELPKYEPSNRVWQGILAGVHEGGFGALKPQARKTKRFEAFVFQGRARYAWAAALLILIVGWVAIGLRPWKSASPLSEQDRFTLAKLEEAEKHYQLAIQALSEAIGSQKNGLEPQIAAVFDKNLREIDTVIQACQGAIRKEPNNLEVRQYLLGAYKDKVGFLDNVIDVKRKSPSANATGKTI
jgi:anti-sigma factor RsiW